MNAKGRAFCYGADIDTDVIIPARYLNTSDPKELAVHCMEDSKQDINAGLPVFSKRVKEGDIIVAQKNFGCGSSREHAPLALKASGVKIVIAKSFARIFFRNAINTGLLVIEDARMADEISQNDTLTIDSAKIKDITTGKEYVLPTLDGYVQKIIEAGGLMNLIKEEN